MKNISIMCQKIKPNQMPYLSCLCFDHEMSRRHWCYCVCMSPVDIKFHVLSLKTRIAIAFYLLPSLKKSLFLTLQCWKVSIKWTITCTTTNINNATSIFFPDSFAAPKSTAKNKVHIAIRNAELPTNQCNQSNTHRLDVSGWGLKYAIIGWAQAQRILANPVAKRNTCE